jgi:transcriptional regulator GlxA family with amidase domain
MQPKLSITMKQIIIALILLVVFTSSDAQPKALTVALFLYDDVEILDFAGPMEVFLQAGFNVFTVGPSKNIKAMNKLKITVDYVVGDNIPQADIIALPGGDGALEYIKHKKVMEWIKSSVQRSKYNFSVCSGAYLLAQTGILDGKKSTTFHSMIDDMATQYPKVTVLRGVRYVDNGKEITTAGISAGIDGALHLVARIKGEQAAKEVAFNMEYDKWMPGEGLIVK